MTHIGYGKRMQEASEIEGHVLWTMLTDGNRFGCRRHVFTTMLAHGQSIEHFVGHYEHDGNPFARRQSQMAL